MTPELALVKTSPFDTLKFVDDNGTQRWSARDLMPALGYTAWHNFHAAITRAKAAYTATHGETAAQTHFYGVVKMVEIGSGTQRPVAEYHLTRHAAYLVAMNGEPNKPEIAAAQNYFAEQTRRSELAQQTIGSNPLAALNQIVPMFLAALNDHDARITALEARPVAIEPDRTGTGFVTVLGFCRTHGVHATRGQMAAWSKRAGRESAYRNLPTGTIPDERYGHVKTYRVEVLTQIIPR